MCDGYSGYNKVSEAKRTACWAHIRRYLIDAVPKGKQLDYTQPAVQGVMYVNQLFELEKKIRQKHAGDYEAIRKARLEKEKPVVDGFLAWLKDQSPTRGSRMAKAVTYIRNREPYLATYLENGRCSFQRQNRTTARNWGGYYSNCYIKVYTILGLLPNKRKNSNLTFYLRLQLLSHNLIY